MQPESQYKFLRVTVALVDHRAGKPHPYDAICTAGDDHVSGIPLVVLREADAQDV